jgi:glycosyltransferase involved in cell wall biosynthesis
MSRLAFCSAWGILHSDALHFAVRITFILPIANLNGGTRVVSIHAKALAERGHRVVILSLPPSRPTGRHKLRAWLRGETLEGTKRQSSSHLDGLNLDHRILDRRRPPTDLDVPDADVVVATWWETAEWVSLLAPGKGAKVYFIQHHEVFPHLPVERCHATYRLPMHKIVIARWLKDVMKTEYSDDVVDLVPNSVDRRQFFSEVRGKQAVPTVGFLYAAGGPKGLDVTLEAIREIRKAIPKLRIISFGSVHPEPAFPLPQGTEFSFSPPQDEIRSLYSQCDVWITASRTEGFNLPALEAMACRTSVASTRAGWPAEAIETRKNGVLVDVDDTKGLQEGVLGILSLPDDEWRALSRRAYETSEVGSWEESSRRFEEALLHACRRAKKGEISGACGCGEKASPP